MLTTTYDHGDESPATDLTARQLRAALADRGGALWADLRAPTDADAALLSGALRLPPPAVAWLCHGAARPEPAAGDALTLVSLADAAGELDVVLGPNVVVTRDRGSRGPARHLADAAAARASLRAGADGLAAALARAAADDLDGAGDALAGSLAQARTDAARRPGELGRAVHAVQRRAAALAEAIAASQSAVQGLRAAAGHDGARATFDGALTALAATAADVQAVAEQARSAAPSPELIALATLARDVATLRRLAVAWTVVGLGIAIGAVVAAWIRLALP